MSVWSTPAEVVPPEPMVALHERWARMAEKRGPVIQVLGPDAGQVPGEDSVGIAPALAEVAQALPGVVVGGVHLDWPAGCLPDLAGAGGTALLPASVG